MDKDCNELSALFQETICDIKASFSVYDEFTNKAVKLNSAIKSTIGASSAFHEAFLKLADMSNGTRGATRDIGCILTRLCLRQQAVENKLKTYTASLADLLVAPIQKSLDDWQKNVMQLDKDHGRDYKKACSDLKKSSGETFRLQKKVNKGKSDLQSQLEDASRDATAKLVALEELEKRFVTSALLEERSHLCLLASCLKPVLDNEIAMLSELEQLQEIANSLADLSSCNSLPPVAEQVIENAIHGQQSPHPPEGYKKKPLKDDMHIEVVTGTLRSGSDSQHMQLVDLPALPSDDISPPILDSSSKDIYVKRSHTLQSRGNSSLRIGMQKLEGGRYIPYESCQSLQCSSGYGTMTNVSTGSVETVESFGVYEVLPDSFQAQDIPQFDKFSTLPSRHEYFSGQQPSSKPSYAVGLQSIFSRPQFSEENVCGNKGEYYDDGFPAPYQGSEPLPPMPSQSQSVPAFEDLPLPPPPEDLLPVADGSGWKGQSSLESHGHRKSHVLPINMTVMQSLNAKLVTKNSVRQEPDCGRVSNWSDRSSECSNSVDSNDDDGYAFAKQLKSIKLRRAVSHDRSAPRLPKQ